jgi:hypothetical protein
MKSKSPETMSYFKNRMRQLRGEYVANDRQAIIMAAGSKCAICGRVKGDEYTFGPTHYLKKKLLFKVYIDIHVIEGSVAAGKNVVLCCGCHMGYHLFNRLSEDADFGNQLVSETSFKRCKKCAELTCMCCDRCGKASKWCRCERGPLRDGRKKRKK